MDVDTSRMYEQFNVYVSRMTGLSATTKLVATAWLRVQSTRTEEHERPGGMYLCSLWELEDETQLSKNTVRKALDELVRFGIIERRTIKAMRNSKGEIHLTKISISSLEHADLNGNIPQASVKPLPRCSCGEVHVVDTMTRTCKSCGTVQQLYQVDHAAHYDQIAKFYTDCLFNRENCHVPVGQMMKLYHTWFWLQEDPGTKKPLKSEPMKRILHELGVHYRNTNSFRRYEGVGLTEYAQQLLEGSQS